MLEDMKKRENYDLMVLDVALPGMDGNKTAREFRKMFPETLLVFCSGVCMPTVESFETTPYRYWLKSYTKEQMQQEIDGVLFKIKKSKVMPYIKGKKENEIVRVSAKQIYYIAIFNKGTMIYCGESGETYTSSQKLAEFYEQLKQFGFANYQYTCSPDRKCHICILCVGCEPLYPFFQKTYQQRYPHQQKYNKISRPSI